MGSLSIYNARTPTVGDTHHKESMPKSAVIVTMSILGAASALIACLVVWYAFYRARNKEGSHSGDEKHRPPSYSTRTFYEQQQNDDEENQLPPYSTTTFYQGQQNGGGASATTTSSHDGEEHKPNRNPSNARTKEHRLSHDYDNKGPFTLSRGSAESHQLPGHD